MNAKAEVLQKLQQFIAETQVKTRLCFGGVIQLNSLFIKFSSNIIFCRGADKSLARPGRTQATATEDFDVRISYLLS